MSTPVLNAGHVMNALLDPSQNKSKINMGAYSWKMNAGLVSRNSYSRNRSLRLRVSAGDIQQGGSHALRLSSPAELVKTGFDLNEL